MVCHHGVQENPGAEAQRALLATSTNTSPVSLKPGHVVQYINVVIIAIEINVRIIPGESSHAL